MTKVLLRKYETDDSKVYYAKVDGTFAVQAVIGAQPEAALTDIWLVRRSKNDKEPGIQPRCALFERAIGAVGGADDRYTTQGKAYKRVTILTKAKYTELSGTPPADIVMGNATFKFVKLIPEKRQSP